MPFNMGVILQMIYTAEVEENYNKGEKRMKMPLYVLVFVTTLPTTTIFFQFICNNFKFMLLSHN